MQKRKPRVQEALADTPNLPDLCTEAADHVASARLSLDDPACDPDLALTHLDDAILCLKRLLARGLAAREDQLHAAARSA